VGDVVPFGKKPEPPAPLEQWGAGEAFCFSCDHTWAVTAPTGTKELECPGCKRHTGRFKFEFVPPEGTTVWQCRCGNQLFYMTPAGHLCPSCGTYQRY